MRHKNTLAQPPLAAAPVNVSLVRGYLKRIKISLLGKFLYLRARPRLLQEFDESLSALDRHGVVNAGAQTADALVALEVIVTGSLGSGDDFGVELGGIGDGNGYSARTELGLHACRGKHLEESEVIDDLGLLDVALMHDLETADALEVLEHLAAAVNRPAVRGVVHGVVLGVGCHSACRWASWDRDPRG